MPSINPNWIHPGVKIILVFKLIYQIMNRHWKIKIQNKTAMIKIINKIRKIIKNKNKFIFSPKLKKRIFKVL